MYEYFEINSKRVRKAEHLSYFGPNMARHTLRIDRCVPVVRRAVLLIYYLTNDIREGAACRAFKVYGFEFILSSWRAAAAVTLRSLVHTFLLTW